MRAIFLGLTFLAIASSASAQDWRTRMETVNRQYTMPCRGQRDDAACVRWISELRGILASPGIDDGGRHDANTHILGASVRRSWIKMEAGQYEEAQRIVEPLRSAIRSDTSGHSHVITDALSVETVMMQTHIMLLEPDEATALWLEVENFGGAVAAAPVAPGNTTSGDIAMGFEDFWTTVATAHANRAAAWDSGEADLAVADRRLATTAFTTARRWAMRAEGRGAISMSGIIEVRLARAGLDEALMHLRGEDWAAATGATMRAWGYSCGRLPAWNPAVTEATEIHRFMLPDPCNAAMQAVSILSVRDLVDVPTWLERGLGGRTIAQLTPISMAWNAQ